MFWRNGTILLFTLLFTPLVTNASVYISEVAWMGDSDNANAEWIELYNDGVEVDLSEWTLTASDGQPSIVLTGVLGVDSYALLERTSDETVPFQPAFMVYSGALGNTGELLELRDQNGVLVDSVDGSDEWSIGGNNDTKETLQRSGNPPIGTWITSTPTPQGSEPISVSNDDDANEVSSAARSLSAGGRVIYGKESDDDDEVHLEPALILTIGDDRTVTRGVPVTFSAKTYTEHGRERVIDTVQWSFGDGAVAEGREVTHEYNYTGDYVVAARAVRGGFMEEITDSDSVVIHVVEPTVSIVQASGDFVEVKNNGRERYDLSGHILTTETAHFVVPENTYILPNASVRFCREYTGVHGSAVTLRYPGGEVLSTYATTEELAPVTPVVTKEYRELGTVVEEKSVPTTEQELDEVVYLPSEIAAVAHAYDGEVFSSGDGSTEQSPWWWILGLFTAIVTVIVVTLLVRHEEQEVIEGFVIETIDG